MPTRESRLTVQGRENQPLLCSHPLSAHQIPSGSAASCLHTYNLVHRFERISGFAEFHLNQLVDDTAYDSIFEVPQNSEVLKLAQKKLQKDSALDPQTSQRKLQQFEKLLISIYTNFLLTCGISPRAWQYFHMLYRTLTQGRERGLFIIEQDLVVLGRPPAKAYTKQVEEEGRDQWNEDSFIGQRLE